jgi:8-oxo-dGTP pyrophosphatase MutT (NUDIX family)
VSRDDVIDERARGGIRSPAPPDLSPGALRRRLAAALARDRHVVALDDRVRAAVLVLFVYRQGRPGLVFAKKTDDVPHHKGQFSFPGGVVRAADASIVEAALREAHEEIGIAPAAVEVLGLFDDSPTSVTNFVITPVLALARAEPVFRPDGREIERVLEIPLTHLLDPACFREEIWDRGGVSQAVVFFRHGDDVVWGVTGRILRGLLDALFPELRRGARPR